MSSINKAAIIAKAKECIASGKKQKEISRIVDREMLGLSSPSKGSSSHSAQQTAEKFIEVMRDEINSNPGISAISDDASMLTYSTPTRNGNGTYSVEINFTGDLERHSVAPWRYDDIKNIIALFNNGYDAANPVYGYWHGKKIRTKTSRTGTYFINNAVNNFMRNYAREYNVRKIEVNDIYNR